MHSEGEGGSGAAPTLPPSSCPSAYSCTPLDPWESAAWLLGGLGNCEEGLAELPPGQLLSGWSLEASPLRGLTVPASLGAHTLP